MSKKVMANLMGKSEALALLNIFSIKSNYFSKFVTNKSFATDIRFLIICEVFYFDSQLFGNT